jgi:hypothetical protein
LKQQVVFKKCYDAFESSSVGANLFIKKAGLTEEEIGILKDIAAKNPDSTMYQNFIVRNRSLGQINISGDLLYIIKTTILKNI